MRKKSKYYLMVLDRIELAVEHNLVPRDELQSYLNGFTEGIREAAANNASSGHGMLSWAEWQDLKQHITRVCKEVAACGR